MNTIPATLLRWGGGILAAAVIASGAYSTADGLAQHTVAQTTQTYSTARQLTVSAAGDITLTVDPEAQDITVKTTARTGFNKPQLSAKGDAQSRSIDYSCPAMVSGSCRANLDVRVPAGIAMRASSDTGDVAVKGDGTGHGSALTARSGTGSVTVSDWPGDVSARSDTGAIKLEGIAGDSTVQSDTGDVLVTKVSGSCHVTTSTGSVTLGGVRGDIAGRTDTGDILVTAVSGAGPVALDAKSDTGTTTINAPTDPASDVSVSLRSNTGNIVYQ